MNGHVARMMEVINAYKILVAELEGKSDIKMDFK
jgi:hypothetical protein